MTMHPGLRSFIKSLSAETYLVTGVVAAAAAYIFFGDRRFTSPGSKHQGINLIVIEFVIHTFE